ncbi:LysE family translocator [uncultured Marinobacter sp.]|uniref:LysE family translocator n=1 Tax=uncultured Marinobacter sp. TaxID=187379 RepID=UPI0030D8F705|tara:strand:+ start:1438 stop:2061 length:624 start_codon:yes stop_codon:yes gene_type:complete
MTIETWALYIGTVLLFMCTPGPSHLLMLSVSTSNGFQRSLATAAGDLTANAIQIVLAGLGLAAALNASKYGFSVVKWLGVSYLVWLGTRQIIKSFTTHGVAAPSRKASLKTLWARGFITSAANPKAVVFFAALFPQFLSSTHSLFPQILVLGFSYIVIDGIFLSAYGKCGNWIATKLSSRKQVWVERFSGAGLIGAALLLGLKSQRS